jgi:type 1 glutamine amidotransferase
MYMERRETLKAAAAASIASFAKPRSAAKRKVLYFTRSAGFEHLVVQRQGAEISHSERLLAGIGGKAAFDVESTKDGRIFDGSLDAFDVIAFYTSGDLTQPAKDGSPPMTPTGKRKLLDAISAGKGFVGFHSAADTFRSQDPPGRNPQPVDPYIAMLGGEFLMHGEEQEAALLLTTRNFPGIRNLGVAEGLAFTEEWYTFRSFASDLHVILVQETQMMKGDAYRRPDYPQTWARLHGKGRVFYTSMGHRKDTWTNPFFQAIVVGGLEWAAGLADADVPPNMDAVTPLARRQKNL